LRAGDAVGFGEIFTALFELELRGPGVKQFPGKNYVRCF